MTGENTVAGAFREVYGNRPEIAVAAPGRVNLIGEHTDYNGGWVLPIAVDRYVRVAARKRGDRRVRAHSEQMSASVEFSLDDIQRDPAERWGNYVRGVAHFLEMERFELAGADLFITGDVPQGAGLSSSAAFEVALVAAWQRLMKFSLDPLQVIRLARRAENDFVGVPCGIMDQFVSYLGRRNHALLIDCRDLSYRHVPIPDDVGILVCHTGVRRALEDSEYPLRVDQCREAVGRLAAAGLSVFSLRDVNPAMLEEHRDGLDPVLWKRAYHVVRENQRVQEAVLALEEKRTEYLGWTMNESHRSLREDFEVSCPELDAMVDIVRSKQGVLGARMTGAGFGGCTVNLVRREHIESVAEAVRSEYVKATDLQPEIYLFQAADGAEALNK